MLTVEELAERARQRYGETIVKMIAHSDGGVDVVFVGGDFVQFFADGTTFESSPPRFRDQIARAFSRLRGRLRPVMMRR